MCYVFLLSRTFLLILLYRHSNYTPRAAKGNNEVPPVDGASETQTIPPTITIPTTAIVPQVDVLKE